MRLLLVCASLGLIAAPFADNAPAQQPPADPATLAPNQASATAARIWRCPMEIAPGTPLHRGANQRGGGMAGNGWDGAGQGSVTIFWRQENTTADMGPEQRTALIAAMQTWANIVEITFQELPVSNRNVQVDWAWVMGDHSAFESDESGDPDCPFDGAGGTIAHAGFPPGVNSQCVNPMTETWAGNVHFDDAEAFEFDDDPAVGDGMWSLIFVAAHEVGHGIGLTHDSSPGAHIMRSSGDSDIQSQAPSASDTANLQAGYAAGTGAVITLNQTGVWVNGGFAGTELGTVLNPFNTVIEGVNGVPFFSENVVVHIQAGSYNETMTVTKNLFLQAENGTVNIGI